MQNSTYRIKIIMVLTGAIGLILFMSNLTVLQNARFGQFWETTKGVIVSNEIEKSYPEELPNSLQTKCRAEYEFQFKANGRTITVKDKDPSGFIHLSYDEVQKRMKPFSPDTEVTVHYDPNCPELPNSAFFERPGGPVMATFSNMWPTTVGLVLISGAFILGLFTEMRRTLLILSVQAMRIVTAIGIIFLVGIMECRYSSGPMIMILCASIPISIILVIFLFRPLLKIINHRYPK